MNYITHSLGGVGAGLIVLGMVPGNEITDAVIMSGAVLGSLFPDIDHPMSFMGRKAPVVSHLAAATFKHRGFLHSPLFIFLAAIALTAGSNMFLTGEALLWASHFIQGFVPGMLCHIIFDTLNKQGIPWLWPYKKRFRLLPIRTDGIMEKIFTICLGLFIGSYFI